jgi:hypothetical protein
MSILGCARTVSAAVQRGGEPARHLRPWRTAMWSEARFDRATDAVIGSHASWVSPRFCAFAL